MRSCIPCSCILIVILPLNTISCRCSALAASIPVCHLYPPLSGAAWYPTSLRHSSGQLLAVSLTFLLTEPAAAQIFAAKFACKQKMQHLKAFWRCEWLSKLINKDLLAVMAADSIMVIPCEALASAIYIILQAKSSI